MPGKTKVLHVVEAYGGGVQSALHYWISQSANFEHHLITDPQSPYRIAKNDGFATVIPLPTGHVRRMLAIRRAVKFISPDVVHAHSSLAGVYARVLPTLKQVRLVYSPHCYAFERTDVSRFVRLSFYAVEKLLTRRTTAVLAVSKREELLAKDLRASIPTYVARVYGNDALAPANQRLGQRADAVVVGIGRLAPQKDPDFFATVARIVNATSPHVHFRWIGDGSKALRRNLENAGVEVTGWRSASEVTDAIAACDLVVHTAAWEGSPVALEEALAMQKPIVARDIPVMHDIGVTRIANTPSELAGHVLAVLRNEAAYMNAVLEVSRVAQQRRVNMTSVLYRAYDGGAE